MCIHNQIYTPWPETPSENGGNGIRNIFLIGRKLIIFKKLATHHEKLSKNKIFGNFDHN